MSGKVIDMTVPGHIDTARRLALASTPDTRWGQMNAFDLTALADPDAMLWTVFTPIDDDENDVCAITGNGPTSEANAAFFVDARAIVLGLLDEIDRLKTTLRNANGGHEWTRHPREGWTVCKSCGMVRNYEDGNKTCAGHLPNTGARGTEGAPVYMAPEQTGGRS